MLYGVRVVCHLARRWIMEWNCFCYQIKSLTPWEKSSHWLHLARSRLKGHVVCCSGQLRGWAPVLSSGWAFCGACVTRNHLLLSLSSGWTETPVNSPVPEKSADFIQRFLEQGSSAWAPVTAWTRGFFVVVYPVLCRMFGSFSGLHPTRCQVWQP